LLSFGDDTGNHFQAQHGALAKLSETAIKTNALVAQTNKLSGQFFNGMTAIGDLCIQTKATLSKLFFINMATYKMVLALTTSLPCHLERSLFNEPFILEDPIGRICPVHLDCISSWEALNAVLETRFRGLQGHKKIQDGHWALQDHATGRAISRRRNWEGAFLPGQRVAMSMLFYRGIDVDSPAQAPTSSRAACPSCQADVSDSSDAETRWYFYQRPNNIFRADTQ
jgi:hypothetical protein